MKVKVAQLCLTLCSLMDYRVHGILQARILEWGAYLLQQIFLTQESNEGLLHCRQVLYQLSYQRNAEVTQSCPTLLRPHGLYSP